MGKINIFNSEMKEPHFHKDSVLEYLNAWFGYRTERCVSLETLKELWGGEVGGIPDYQATLCPYQFASWVGIPCWSLAALLKVLLCPSLCNTFGEWRCQCYKEDHIVATSYADNPVDACYEIIIKLHEQKLITIWN